MDRPLGLCFRVNRGIIRGPASITLTGWVARATYELVLYSAANVPGCTSIFAITGSGAAASSTIVAGSAQGNFNTAGTNYDRLTVTADATGTRAINIRGPRTPSEANRNALQLQRVESVPEPSALVLMAAAGLALVVRRRPIPSQ